ncbi:ABC transporter substrate-binding protein [Actinomadura darangshiensis]|uniref:ABC transporter substrate-binding protein n=1 Tax=Actinomadura darangshiensis TaxID=705336 RepID=A0A4R5AK03_9ACTN|nr:ABC transporter substrate-binding protein [Actinomadura darangshiensis]TDD71846.1 ABC transporter substrate-binding protein [Actinomadura darangshiensis]
MSTRRTLSAASAALVLAAAGCATPDSGLDAAGRHLDGRGPITYVQASDTAGVATKQVIETWNRRHPDQRVTLRQFSDVDELHDNLVHHFKAEDADYDVLGADVVTIAEYAAHRWLQPFKGAYTLDTSALLEQTVKTARYQGTLYAAPFMTDAGLLYYRKDLVPRPPRTWQELLGHCKIARERGMGCYAGQFAKYEGLTVNVAEAVAAAGGSFVKADGTTPSADTPAARKGLSLLVDAYRSGDIPKEAITYQEEESREAFEAGKLLFLRNWSYVYPLASSDGGSVVKGKFGVAMLPGVSGPGRTALGGQDNAVNVYSEHKATARDFLIYLQSPGVQRELLIKQGQSPVVKSLYHDKKLLDDPALGYLGALERSIATATERPVTPFYPAVTQAISQNAYAAIKGEKPVGKALEDIQAAILAATSEQ